MRVHHWTPKTTATGGKQTWNPRTPRHDVEPRKPAPREPSKTRRYIIEALTEVPKGMTCASICQAKRIQKKSAEMMLSHMLADKEIHIVGHEVNRFNRKMRVYALAQGAK